MVRFIALVRLNLFGGKANKRTSIILSATIALSIIAAYVLLSIVNGRIHADSRKATQGNGTTASAVLENADETQYLNIKELDYISETALIRKFGYCYMQQKKIANCGVISPEEFQIAYAPAYDDICGSYPVKEDEVMLSMRLLSLMGIKNPEIGMRIPIHIIRYDWLQSGAEDIEKFFILSGYYTDYTNDLSKLPVAFFTEKVLNEQNISFFPADVLIKSDSLWLNKKQFKNRFYKDIKIGAKQQFEVISEGSSQTIRNMAGGYAAAAGGTFLILLSMYLFLHNILFISMERGRKQFGLLKALGMTRRQMIHIFLLHGIKIIFTGIILGTVFGSLVVLFVLPSVMKKMFLSVSETIRPSDLYSWKLLLITIVIIGLGAVGTFFQGISMTAALPCIDCLKGRCAEPKGFQFPKTIGGKSLEGMAWRNFTRNRKKMLLTVGSLFLGFEITLLSVVINNGMDQTHKIEQTPDFEIGITKDAVGELLYQNNGKSISELQGHELLPDWLLEEICKTADIGKSELLLCEGSYGIFDYNSKAIQPRTYSYHNDSDIVTELTLQVVPNEWSETLKQYVINEKQNIDIESFLNSNGFILLHSHELTEQQAKRADGAIGQKLSGILMGNEAVSFELTCCGYLDITDPHFPRLNMPWNGKDLNYIIVSEKTMEFLRTDSVIYNIAFKVDREKEPKIKNSLKGILAVANKNSDKENTYYMTAKSDILAQEQGYILGLRMLMRFFSGILMIFAFVSYCYTFASEMLARRLEFVVLRSIGMTERQLKKMILWEGLFYCLCTLALTLSIGNILLMITGQMMKSQASYFVFRYPVSTLLFLSGILVFTGIVIPLFLYHNGNRQSIVEELRSAEA